MQYAHTNQQRTKMFRIQVQRIKREDRRILVFWFVCDGPNRFVLCDNSEMFLPAQLSGMCIRTVCGKSVVLLCTYGGGVHSTWL